MKIRINDSRKKFILNISIDWLLMYSMIFRFTPQSLSRLLLMHFLHINNNKNGMLNHIFSKTVYDRNGNISMGEFSWKCKLREMLAIFLNQLLCAFKWWCVDGTRRCRWRQRDGRFGFYVICQISNCIAWDVNIQFEMKSACFHLVIAQFGQFAS